MEKNSAINPAHYTHYSVEAFQMLERIYGKEFMPGFCEATALLYRLRAGLKENNSIEQEFAKERWWLNKRDYYKKELETSSSKSSKSGYVFEDL